MKVVLAEEHSERNSHGQTWTESRNHHSDSQVTEQKSPKVVLVKPEQYLEWNSCRRTWTERRNHRSDCQVTEQRFLDAHPHIGNWYGKQRRLWQRWRNLWSRRSGSLWTARGISE